MKKLLTPLFGAGLLLAGLAGKLSAWDRLAAHANWFLLAGSLVAAALFLNLTFLEEDHPWPGDWSEPRRLTIGPLHYLKALICWLAAFSRTYAVEPGLYYTGDRYDPESALLVTANYHLTVFLVARRARRFNARLLVVDTDGINVWCAAGKGRFSAERILHLVERFREALGTSAKPRLILPKFCLAGVDLRALRQGGVRPVIGPLYAKDLPEYLSQGEFKDREDDRVVFGLESRLFTLLPGLVQFMYYGAVLVTALLLLGLEDGPWRTLALVAIIVSAYPILFPWLPGRRFAVKGLGLGAILSLAAGALGLARTVPVSSLPAAALFIVATSIFFGLSYTGNSAVSNYTRVRQEIAAFLPVVVVLYAASLAAALLL